MIVVQEDVIVAAARSEAEKSRKMPDWAQVKSGLGPAAIALGVMRATSGIWFQLGAAALIAAKEIYEAWSRAREAGLDILQISHTEARQLKLPPGHPRPGTVYVVHPTMTDRYYTIAAYHRLAFEHKVAEAIQLLMSLGATRIKIEHVRGWNSEFNATIAGTIPGSSATATAKESDRASSSLLFDAEYANEQSPALPANLYWYHNEPTWMQIASGRLNYGLKNFSLSVVYEDDHGVNAGLKMKAEKAGLDVGGSFENHVATTWKISGNFNDRRAGTAA